MLSALQSKPWFQSLSQYLPAYLLENLFLTGFGLTKVPMLFFLQPRVVALTEEKCIIKIPLGWRSKNHLNSMYFGALAAGADCAGGFMAMKIMHEEKWPISLVFKDFKAEFLKRAEGDTWFVCEDGALVRELMNTAMRTGERQNCTVKVEAFVPAAQPQDPVARFELTLSVKKRASHV
ncbi:MAG: PaaI family thioesterase [Candidatus Sericytochromatia bacterium]|nr:PaaI family thioesterase [Candidatus Sericytochromatia bacterium]